MPGMSSSSPWAEASMTESPTAVTCQPSTCEHAQLCTDRRGMPRCDPVRCGAILCDPVWCGAVLCCAVLCCAVLCCMAAARLRCADPDADPDADRGAIAAASCDEALIRSPAAT